MRSEIHDVADMLQATAKKKPHLQALIDSLESHTLESIDALDEKPWVKKALKAMKVRGLGKWRDIAADFVDCAATQEYQEKWIEAYTPMHDCEVYEWIGGDAFFPFGGLATKGQGGFSIEVKNGDLFLFDGRTGNFFYEHIRTKLPHDKLVNFAHKTRRIGYANYPKYRELQAAATNRIYGGSAPQEIDPYSAEGLALRNAGNSYRNPNKPTEIIFKF
jgi:hypothetical protein